MKPLPGLISFFIATKIFKRRIPLLANFKLTYQCNLRCAGCPYHLRSHEGNSHMSWKTATQCLDSLKDMGCRIVIFEGGEPLLWKDGDKEFPDLARYARSRFTCVGATTNGTLPLNVPTDVLWVSIDGMKDTHDRLRSNSFNRVMDNISTAAHHRLYAHFTMNSENWREIDGLVSALSGMNPIKGITVQLFYPYNQGEKNLALSHQERKQALQRVIALKRKGFPVLNSYWGLESMINNTWTCHKSLLANVDPDGRISTGCYVDGRGEVRCADCGFTPVAEASGALDLVPGALVAGWRIFLS